MTDEQAIKILNQAPYILCFTEDFRGACKLATGALQEKNYTEEIECPR
jgi:hypothetical protein